MCILNYNDAYFKLYDAYFKLFMAVFCIIRKMLTSLSEHKIDVYRTSIELEIFLENTRTFNLF